MNMRQPRFGTCSSGANEQAFRDGPVKTSTCKNYLEERDDEEFIRRKSSGINTVHQKQIGPRTKGEAAS